MKRSVNSTPNIYMLSISFFFIYRSFTKGSDECFQANIYLLKVNNRNIRKRCEIYS